MLVFRKAELHDVEPLVAFINAAYRGDTSRQGWTTEADLLDGLRTSHEEIHSRITSDASFILLCLQGSQLVGCVCVERQAEQASIGMFAVNPVLQGQGIGKQLLKAAEQAAQQAWAVTRLVMTVIPLRSELIAFYQRRGYRRTGVLKPFPVNPALWTPKVSGLQLELLEKLLVDGSTSTRVEFASS